MQPRCPKCDMLIVDYDADRNVCAKCQDVLEFGYPAFDAYALEDSDDQSLPQSVDLSEDWVLPEYIPVYTR